MDSSHRVVLRGWRLQNRVLVMFQWAWNYFTRNRAARLITGTDAEAREKDRAGSPSSS